MNNHDVPLLQVSALAKEFRTKTVSTRAVDAVSLTVERGDYVVLCGQSGCGKSTLLSMLALIEKPTSGDIVFDGQSTAAMTDAERAQIRATRLGVVFQSFHLIPELSAVDNVMLGVRYHPGWNQADKLLRAHDALSRVGLASRTDHFPDQLSGGQQQRVAIARALAGDRSLILADEPTGNLDSESGDNIMGLFDAIHADGVAICMVTHDARYQSRGTRRITMKDGQIV